MSSISKFYQGRSIFVTGATGFLGKVLIERILSTCPGIENIYILVRRKRGQDPQQRVQKLTSSLAFDRLRREHPEVLRKLVAVPGDLCSPDLGIDASNWEKLARSVSVVFHSAATVRFDEPLDLCAQINLYGTQQVMRLCNDLDTLDAAVHVSSAYSNSNRLKVDEKLYPVHCTADELYERLQKVKGNIESETPKILGDWPNTYTLTKALSEIEVAKHSNSFPCAIARPTIVSPSWRDPFPGWVDAFNVATACSAGTALGLCRSILCRRGDIIDLMPVDFVANSLIGIAWYIANTKPTTASVFNCASSGIHPVTNKVLTDIWFEHSRKNPLKSAFWYPGGHITANETLHKLRSNIYHRLPIGLADMTLKMIGRDTEKTLRSAKLLYQALNLYDYFTAKEFIFKYGNIQKIYDEMSPEDRDTFPVDVTRVDWEEYTSLMYVGIKKYLFKEDENPTQKSLKKMQRLYWLHRSTQATMAVALGGIPGALALSALSG